ncbi:hypothetical protein SELMODRAFT_421248 [Selaginella moellendorffii]|uniref:Uncharacterized protein n=1 Tax=Selaginella moellendorffii TaxID=88036 RepID=D8SEG9_SELML|nr:hypothetical protein SELMODRAFT_421248 [Selaginella moellendorffii]
MDDVSTDALNAESCGRLCVTTTSPCAISGPTFTIGSSAQLSPILKWGSTGTVSITKKECRISKIVHFKVEKVNCLALNKIRSTGTNMEELYQLLQGQNAGLPDNTPFPGTEMYGIWIHIFRVLLFVYFFTHIYLHFDQKV